MAYEDVYAEVIVASAITGVADEVSERYVTVLDQLLPPGRIWRWDAGTNARNLLRALGYAFDRIELRGRDLLREFDPTTMQELVPDWERVLGLPGDNPDPPTTLAGRRAAIYTKLLGNENPTAVHFEELATALGYDATVYHKFLGPFIAGSGAGAPVASGWQYYWELVTQRSDNDVLLEWVVAQITPLHTMSKVFWLLEQPVQQTSDGPTSASFNAVAYGNGLWTIVGASGTIQTSPDGETWTARTAGGGFSGTLTGVAYDAVNDLWCLTGLSGTLQTSPDGVTWTPRTAGSGFSSTFYAVYHDGVGTWCAVGNGGEIQTSPDGITWTRRHTGGSALYTVCYGGGIWVAAGFGSTVFTSSDGGVTWVSVTPAGSPGSFRRAAYAEGQFIMVGDGAQVQISADGNDWLRVAVPDTVPPATLFWSVVYIGDRWVVHSSNRVLESQFARHWKDNVLVLPTTKMGYGNDLCVFVGDFGRIYTVPTV